MDILKLMEELPILNWAIPSVSQVQCGKTLSLRLLSQHESSMAIRVTFEPAARTAWHAHPLGQTLYVNTVLAWSA